jgi:tetratricopeptide (TPR) repeat protein
LATEQADAGRIVEALQTARSVRHDAKLRADALRAISALQTKVGSTREAAATLDEALEAVRQAQSSPAPPPSHYDWQIFVEMLCGIAKMQAGNGMMEKAAAAFDVALQVVPTIRDSRAGVRDWATAVALTDIAESQREAGLTGAAVATLDRAVEAASVTKQDYWWDRSALAKVAGAQARFGLAAAAATTIDLAIERARALGQDSQRAMALSDIARICAEIGLRAEAIRVFDEALGFARAIAERGNLLLAIAEIQLKAGVLDRAEATFEEALSHFLSSQNGNRRKPNLALYAPNLALFAPNLALYLNGVVRSDMTTPFIASSSALRPQIVQIAQSLYSGGDRAAILCNIANALPN